MRLRTRLLLASATIVGVVLVGAVLIQQSQARYLTGQIDEQLSVSRPFLRPPPTSVGPLPDQGLGTPDQPVSNLYVGIVDGTELTTILQGQLLGDVPDIEPSDLASAADGEPFTVDGAGGESRFRVSVTEQDGGLVSVLALPLDEVDRAVERLRWGLAVGAVGIIGTLVLAVWWVEHLGLRPVGRVTEVADAIAGGDRTRRVDDSDPRTEAGRLATAFNVMLDERDASEERLRRFVSDASHELRTPLTSIRGYLDLYSEGGFRGDGQLDDAIRRMSHEATRMHALVEDLLLLAKLDEHPPLREEPIDIAQLLEDVASDARVLQPDRRILVAVPRSVTVVGDPLRIEQLVGILVSNAMIHTDRSTEIHLSATCDDAWARVVVRDTGEGLDPEHAARIFDRFYRGDDSRARLTGGSGLGLAIARSIVDAHHGGIALETARGSGCTFTVRLPRGSPSGP